MGIDVSAQKKKRPRSYNSRTLAEQKLCIDTFERWSDQDQVEFLCCLLSRMSHSQHSQINKLLEPLLQRDFIIALQGELNSAENARPGGGDGTPHNLPAIDFLSSSQTDDPCSHPSGLPPSGDWNSPPNAAIASSSATPSEIESSDAILFANRFYKQLYPRIIRDIKKAIKKRDLAIYLRLCRKLES
ncbi:unnamed protein product [Dibothriocephalus latus]|uniref:D domain-containing protein n=1 Tax=Dibothriocephalus latus TaxID=60516 RepID=A0A3P6UD16_DIBLA|nr:unnamed protein product [Dibothriocephalus latus]